MGAFTTSVHGLSELKHLSILILFPFSQFLWIFALFPFGFPKTIQYPRIYQHPPYQDIRFLRDHRKFQQDYHGVRELRRYKPINNKRVLPIQRTVLIWCINRATDLSILETRGRGVGLGPGSGRKLNPHCNTHQVYFPQRVAHFLSQLIIWLARSEGHSSSL